MALTGQPKTVMSKFISNLAKAKLPEKNTRDAFLYFNPHDNSPEEEFAQCGTCRFFVPEEAMNGAAQFDLCIAHGSKQKVGEDYSCGLYVVWPKGTPDPEVVSAHADELRGDLPGSVTPEESGLVDRQVRCDNCIFFDDDKSKCNLYLTLNAKLPKLWELDPNVDEDGCCNANIEKPGSARDREGDD